MFFEDHPLGNEINVALNAINKGKEILFKSPKEPSIYYKSGPLSGNEIFTEVDIEINETIIELIEKSYPSDSIIGEERSLMKRKKTERFWLVDPIDGTRSFIESKYGSSIMLSLVSNGIPMFGIIYDINNDNIIVAIKGKGIFTINDHIDLLTKPTNFKRKIAWNPYADSELKDLLLESLKMDGVIEVESSGLRALEIAKGNASFMISLPGSAKIWDTAPGFIILNEIRGHITDINNKTLYYSTKNRLHIDGAIASIEIDHDKISNLLKTF